MRTKQFQSLRLLMPLIALVWSILACGERNFDSIQVYSATKGNIEEFYDFEMDKILVSNVWVFKPNGTYEALIELEGEIRSLRGKYGGDDLSKNEFAFSIDTNDDGVYDDNLWVTNGDFSIIEWRRKEITLKYFQITPFP